MSCPSRSALSSSSMSSFRTKRMFWAEHGWLSAAPYDSTTEDQLSSHGINVVIYANHLLRAAYPAMQRAARDILTHRKAGPLNEYCASSHDLLSLFPEPDVCSLRAS
jgi:hypothetical protein